MEKKDIKARLLTKLDVPINDEIKVLIDDLLNQCFTNIVLTKVIKKLSIKQFLNYNIEQAIIDKVKHCQEVYICLCSLGDKSQIFLESQPNNDIFQNYLIHEIFNLMLESYTNDIICNLAQNLDQNMGLTANISPGEKDISMQTQKIIFNIIKPNNFSLNESSYFITPVKSYTFIIGAGKGLTTPSFNERCLLCNYPKCHKYITIHINMKPYTVKLGSRLYDVLIQNNIFFENYCGGNRICGKCKVTIKDKDGYKEVLACQTICTNNLEVYTSAEQKMNIEKVYNGIRHKPKINNPEDKYGIVFDVGTTTIVGALYSLKTGKKLNIQAYKNDQYIYGPDVISRINYSITNGVDPLNNLIIKQLNMMISSLYDFDLSRLSQIIIVGNPTMISIINNINLNSLSKYPFTSQVNNIIETDATKLGLISKAIVTFIYGVSAFIGSDIVCGVLATKLYQSLDYQLLIDLGTNGEIALGNKDVIYTCSTAAGPAFEGGNISCGVPSISGAIKTFAINNNTISYETINNLIPIGFCGSGIIDLIASLLKNKYINDKGTFVGRDYLEMILENQTFKFTQQDVREFQLAKSAILTGIELLMTKANISYDMIKHVYISGGFGSNLNINNAISVGLFPKQFKDRIIAIGNSALYGGTLYLLSSNYQKIFNDIKDKFQPLELNNEPEFFNLFIKYIDF